MKIKLTHREEEVMQILWGKEKAFVQEIIDCLPDPKPPYNTISSVFRKLEARGIVGHESFGKAYRYYPVLKKEEYRKSLFRKMIDTYFGGSKEKMFSYFIKEEDLGKEELNKLLDDIKNSGD